MKRLTFYPECRWLDPNTRDSKGHFYCERRAYWVVPERTVYRIARGRRTYDPFRCAPDCWHRGGKTRVPTL